MVNYLSLNRHQKASAFMRRQFFIIRLLLCALMLSGWGGLLGAAFCPHAAARAGAVASVAESMSMADDHACCHADAKGSDKHCSNSSHGAMDGMEATPATEPSPQALAPPAASCSHCIGHSSLPAAPTKAGEATQHRPDAHRLALKEVKHIAPPVVRFVSTIAPTQGAPPGPAARKHLLLSIFVI
jgi:hypothetical protein